MASFLSRAAELFLLLLIYSFLGWCGEMVYCSIGQRHLCEKRGFLNGPLCPIYGHGALLVLLALGDRWDTPALTFLVGMALTTAVEYVTSYAMEKLFHMRWWDYSRYKLQVNGRVCLVNSLLFGCACLALRYAVHPRVMAGVDWLFARGAALPLAAVLFVLYAADIVLSVRSAIQIGSRLEKLHAIHDELAEKLEQLKEEQRRAMEAQRQRLEAAAQAARSSLAEHTAQAQQAARARLEPLAELGNEFSQRLEKARSEARQRARDLYEKQDIFERRLMRSFPALHSPRHGEMLKTLREYWENRKK